LNALIGLGSNLGDGVALLYEALYLLNVQDAIRVIRVSGFYSTAAWGVEDQANFTNAVAEVDSELPPSDLLRALLLIEQQMGRVRDTVRWGPRVIDLDLLCYGDQIVNTPELELPHPRMHLRAFVLVPLLELEPDFVIPGRDRARACLNNLKEQPVKLLL